MPRCAEPHVLSLLIVNWLISTVRGLQANITREGVTGAACVRTPQPGDDGKPEHQIQEASGVVDWTN